MSQSPLLTHASTLHRSSVPLPHVPVHHACQHALPFLRSPSTCTMYLKRTVIIRYGGILDSSLMLRCPLYIEVARAVTLIFTCAWLRKNVVPKTSRVFSFAEERKHFTFSPLTPFVAGWLACDYKLPDNSGFIVVRALSIYALNTNFSSRSCFACY